MTPARRCGGSVLGELLGALAVLGLLGTLVVAALGAVRQRQRIEAASARLEEAQNLLARWRSADTVSAPGWTLEQSKTANGDEVLTVRAEGVRLSTVRLLSAPSPEAAQ